jgi:hypothetical protein
MSNKNVGGVKNILYVSSEVKVVFQNFGNWGLFVNFILSSPELSIKLFLVSNVQKEVNLKNR